jgi:hypothetical protein
MENCLALVTHNWWNRFKSLQPPVPFRKPALFMAWNENQGRERFGEPDVTLMTS